MTKSWFDPSINAWTNRPREPLTAATAKALQSWYDRERWVAEHFDCGETAAEHNYNPDWEEEE